MRDPLMLRLQIEIYTGVWQSRISSAKLQSFKMHENVYACVPLAVRGGVQRSARGCGRALLRHTQHLQTLPLWPAAAVMHQHG